MIWTWIDWCGNLEPVSNSFQIVKRSEVRSHEFWILSNRQWQIQTLNWASLKPSNARLVCFQQHHGPCLHSLWAFMAMIKLLLNMSVEDASPTRHKNWLSSLPFEMWTQAMIRWRLIIVWASKPVWFSNFVRSTGWKRSGLIGNLKNNGQWWAHWDGQGKGLGYLLERLVRL